MKNNHKNAAKVESDYDLNIKREMERTDAMLRHFRGIALSVIDDALEVWQEIWDACQSPMTCDDVLDGKVESGGDLPVGGWPELREKLHLLRHYIDYTRRLCDGSVEKASGEESEV